MYGANATKENDFGYTWLPKLDDTQNASWLMLFDQMAKGKFKGFFAWGQTRLAPAPMPARCVKPWRTWIGWST
jgi:hypothetical protein